MPALLESVVLYLRDRLLDFPHHNGPPGRDYYLTNAAPKDGH